MVVENYGKLLWFSRKILICVNLVLQSHISQIKMDIDKRIYNIENAFPRAEYSESKANK
jgi:hypothetical protein